MSSNESEYTAAEYNSSMRDAAGDPTVGEPICQKDDSLKMVRQFFEKDHFATENGAVIEQVEDGLARCSMKLTEHHKNAVGAVMGGAIFTLADFTFAVASNWQGTVHVSRTSQITFLGTAKGGQLIATARRIKEGRQTCYYVVEIADELGNQVAHMAIDGFTMQRLTP